MSHGAVSARDCQATVAYFTGRLGLSHRDCVEALRVLHGAQVSTGSISAMQSQVSHALAAPVETAHEFVRHQAVNHVDETGWREQGKLNWLWVNATERVTAFRIAAKRDAATAREVIGAAKHSIITTDRYRWLQLVGDDETTSMLGAHKARLPSYLRTRRRVERNR